MNHFEAYEDENGKWRWRLWTAERKIVASSGEAFDSQEDALRAAKAVRRSAAGAELASAPGLGIKAALRLRALLAGDGAAEETEAVSPTRRLLVRRSAAETVIRVRHSAGTKARIGPAATGTLG